MDKEIIKTLKEILQQKSPGLNPEDITLQDSIRNLGIDSVDFIELIFEVETIFQIEIPTQKLTQINTIQNLVSIISDQKKALA